MLTFLLAAIAGAYAAQRISFLRDGEIATATIDYRQIWQDAIAFFALIGAIAFWVIDIARKARNYCDLALLPWMNDRGIRFTLPTLQLPTMPDKVVQ